MGITGLRSMKRQVQHEQHNYRTIIVWVCLVIERHRRHPNVVRTLVTNSAAPSEPVFCSQHILMSFVIYY